MSWATISFSKETVRNWHISP